MHIEIYDCHYDDRKTKNNFATNPCFIDKLNKNL